MAMEIERINPKELRVRFLDNPSTSAAQEWISRFKEALNGGENYVVVDLTAMEVLASLGVNVVVGMYQRMQKQDGTLEVWVANVKVRQVFKLFKLTDIFEVKVVGESEKA
ncbi:MAG: STAS domain-containing protein [Candidatus Sumerlaeota bacterium]